MSWIFGKPKEDSGYCGSCKCNPCQCDEEEAVTPEFFDRDKEPLLEGGDDDSEYDDDGNRLPWFKRMKKW